MTLKNPGRLRTANSPGEQPEAGAAPGNGRIGGGFETLADLVADLITSTELVTRDRLAAARGRAGTGSLAHALVDEGIAHVRRDRAVARTPSRPALPRLRGHADPDGTRPS